MFRKHVVIVISAWLICSCSYQAIQVDNVTAEVTSISCIELQRDCVPSDSVFETIKFEFTTLKDIESEMEGYELQARCNLDGEDDFAFGPYHEGRNIKYNRHKSSERNTDGKYHYILYAYPDRKGLDILENSSFRTMECSVWGVNMMPVLYPRTSYFGLTNDEFQEKYKTYLLRKSSPNKAPKPTQ